MSLFIEIGKVTELEQFIDRLAWYVGGNNIRVELGHACHLKDYSSRWP